MSSRTISHWAGWSEAVSHNNGTTQLQLHVEDRKVEQDHDPMIQMIRMFHCCSAQRSGSQLWSSGSRPPVGSVRAGARSLTCRGSDTTQLPPLLQPGHQGYCSLRRYLLTTTTRTTDSLDCCMWEVQGSGSVWFNVHVLDVVNGMVKVKNIFDTGSLVNDWVLIILLHSNLKLGFYQLPNSMTNTST